VSGCGAVVTAFAVGMTVSPGLAFMLSMGVIAVQVLALELPRAR